MSRGRVFLGVSLVSAGVLMLQLTLTRLFSATMYYHFAFLAISLALFGSGASGVFIYLAGGRLEKRPIGRWLSLAALLFASTTVLALFVVLGNPLSPSDPWLTTLARLALIYGATALPFFFAGCVVTLAVTRFAGEISRLYFFDLGGAAAGCLLLIPALNLLGAVNAVLVVSVLAAAAALVLDGAPGRWRGSVLVAGTLSALLAYNGATGRIDIRKAKGHAERSVIFARWNSFSRVTVWGSLLGPTVLIMIDADAASLLSQDGNDLDLHRPQRDRVEALAYRLKRGGSALIIGPGGGNDVIMARLFGARPITAVEVNSIIARDIMSSEPFRSYSGAIYEQAGVRLVVDEGRSFLRGSKERYDVIQGTMVDTWAATAAGAFALTENNLYTVEAFKDYLSRLTEGGVLSMTRWHLEPPDQLLRLCSLARAAMDEMKIDDPPWHVMVVRGPPEPGTGRAPATFLFKKSAFTPEEVRAIEWTAVRNSFRLLYTPLFRPPNDFTRLLEAEDPADVWRSLESNVEPTRDNSPFFFHSLRLGNLATAPWAVDEWRKNNLGTFVLVALLAITAAATAAFILGPLALLRGGPEPGPKLSYLLYFACLGAGFIIVEVATVQKCILFLGHPVYALTVVLFSILAFSGIGSHLSGRFREGRLLPSLVAVLVALVVLIALSVATMSEVFYALVHLGRPYRIAITVALLAPLGIVMGMPMPTGIRILARASPGIIPWAWGVNGAASVLGSVAALAIALLSGFNQALLVAAGLYLLAIVFIARPGRAA